MFSPGNHIVQQSRIILAILVKWHKKNIDTLATEMSFKVVFFFFFFFFFCFFFVFFFFFQLW